MTQISRDHSLTENEGNNEISYMAIGLEMAHSMKSKTFSVVRE